MFTFCKSVTLCQYGRIQIRQKLCNLLFVLTEIEKTIKEDADKGKEETKEEKIVLPGLTLVSVTTSC